MLDALALAGIATYASPSDTAPIRPITAALSPMRLLKWQADALALRTSAGTSQQGRKLDAAMALPKKLQKNQPTPSQLVAGYIAAVDSPAAALSRALMAGQDLRQPSDLRFPELVLLLFLSDLATDGGTLPADPPVPELAALPVVAMLGAGVRTAAVGTICSSAATWVENAIHSLFAAIKLRTPDNLPGQVLVTAWNWLVGQGEALVHRLIGGITDAVLGTVRFIAAGVASLVTRVVSLLPSVVSVRTEPQQVFVLPPSAPAPRGVLIASVSAGDLPDWPDIIKDCAGVARIALPELRPAGARVDWKPGGEGLQYIVPVVAQGSLDGNGEARWDFRTLPDGVEGGDPVEVVMLMEVTIHRPEVEEARASLANVLLRNLPDFVADFVGQLFSPYLKAVADRIDKLVSAPGIGAAIIIYHTPKSPVATPGASPGAVDLTCERVIPAAEVQRITGHADMHLVERVADPFGPLMVAHSCSWTNIPPGSFPLPADAYEFVISYGLAKDERALARAVGPLRAEVGGRRVRGIGDAAMYAFAPADANNIACGVLYAIQGDRYVSVAECPADDGTLARLRAGAKVILDRL